MNKLTKKDAMETLSAFAVFMAKEGAKQRTQSDLTPECGRKINVESFAEYLENEGIEGNDIIGAMITFATRKTAFRYESAKLISEEKRKEKALAAEKIAATFNLN